MKIEEIVGIIIQVISVPTSIYGFITLVLQSISWWKRRQTRSLVLSDKRDWAIITPRYSNNFQRKEDILATIKIRDWCTSLGIECTIQDDHDPIPQGKNLFFICGEKANKRVSKFYKGFNLQIQQSNGVFVIRDTLRQMNICSQMDAQNSSRGDYAILSRRIDPISGQIYYFCIGIHGHGTLGAAHMLTTGLTSAITRRIPKAKNFESIVSVPYIDDYCSIANLDFALLPRQ